MKNKVTNTSNFVIKANKVHNDKYDYSKFIYIKSSIKGIIICPLHGTFKQTPNSHLAGTNCPRCGYNKLKLSVDEFIKRANRIHNNKFDYSKVKFNSIMDRVEIICLMNDDVICITQNDIDGTILSISYGLSQCELLVLHENNACHWDHNYCYDEATKFRLTNLI